MFYASVASQQFKTNVFIVGSTNPFFLIRHGVYAILLIVSQSIMSASSQYVYDWKLLIHSQNLKSTEIMFMDGKHNVC